MRGPNPPRHRNHAFLSAATHQLVPASLMKFVAERVTPTAERCCPSRPCPCISILHIQYALVVDTYCSRRVGSACSLSSRGSTCWRPPNTSRPRTSDALPTRALKFVLGSELGGESPQPRIVKSHCCVVVVVFCLRPRRRNTVLDNTRRVFTSSRARGNGGRTGAWSLEVRLSLSRAPPLTRQL